MPSRDSARGRALTLAIVLFRALAPAVARAQELDPGAYRPIPTGISIVTLANSFNWGDLAFDAEAPIDQARARINTTAFGYTHAFGALGRSANVGIALPVVVGHLEGLFLGDPAKADRMGLGDPRLRLGLNVYGAPAMTVRQSASYRPHMLVGASLTVALPLGEYDPDKLVNLGTNRWAFKPEVGLSLPAGPWMVEAMVGAWLFTDNTQFYGGRTRAQDPIVASQLHLTYNFSRGTWLAADANYFTGGRTTVGGERNFDLQRNSRIGATFSSALDRHQSIRLSVSRGARTTIGADFTSVGVSYNYAWSH